MTETVAYVIGAGGHARVVVATLQAAGYEVGGLFDDDAQKRGMRVLEAPVLGPVAEAWQCDASIVLGVGDNRTRRQLAARLGDAVTWGTAVHPAAYVHPSATLGPGTVVFAGAVLQPDVVVGAHAVINTGATVDHDSVLGGFVHVAPGAHVAGNVRLGEGAFLGIGSAAVPGVSVGAWTTVGAGATVTHDLPPHTVATGTPARVRRQVRE